VLPEANYRHRPTMGRFTEGHQFARDTAPVKEAEVVITTIFVNPASSADRRPRKYIRAT